MTNKSFHLRWNNHLQNLQSLFENLYNEQSLIDVTISCSDGLLYGHKLVLSACSPYFEQVFRDNPCKHPVLILKGIKRHEMQVLLEYMYIGSVDVGEEDLEVLLDTATELQIKGLVQRSEENPLPSYQSKTHSSNESSSSITPPPLIPQHFEDMRWQAEIVAKSSFKHSENDSLNKTLNISRNNSANENITHTNQPQHQDKHLKFQSMHLKKDISQTTIIKEEYQEISEEESKDYTAVDCLEESSENMEINYHLPDNKISDSDEINYLCHMCSRKFQNKGSYHRHMLTHAGVKPHHCSFCNQSFLRLSHLQRHIRVHTGERPYSCGKCPKQFARSDKLRQHYIIQHNDADGSKMSKPRGRPRKVNYN